MRMMMMKKFILQLIIIIIIIGEGWWKSEGEGCLEQEKSALLHLKLFFNDADSLTDWVAEGDEKSDCCLWEKVECSNTTGRVIQLDLSGTRESAAREEYWYLNASLFTPFLQLESLDLRDNMIAGCMENEGLERLSGLCNLKVLILGQNLFNNGTVSSLAALSSLTELDLTDNGFKGSIDGLEKLSRLRNLKTLYLSINLLNNSVLSSLVGLSSLTTLALDFNRLEGSIDVKELDSLSNLEELDISYNKIDDLVVPKGYLGLKKLHTLSLSGVGIRDGSKLLRSIGSFPSLKTLELYENNFTETVTTTPDSYNFDNLEELNLDESYLHRSLLQSIASFTALRILSMSACKINGIVRGQDLPKLNNLERLVMDDARVVADPNLLQIISESMTSLKSLSLSGTLNNSIILDQGICELVHLQELIISRNDLRSSLPWCLTNMTSLRVLDISFNRFIENVSSSSLFVHLTSTEKLILSNNHFRIPISLEPFFNLSKLKYFDGANNQIFVQSKSYSLIPKFQLTYFLLSDFGVGGTFPKFLYHQYDLEIVNLSHNNLSEEFPNWLLENNKNLVELVLANNSLSGSFRMPIHSHESLQVLDVSSNNIQGHIPVEIGDILPNLSVFNISLNALNSSIPSSFGDMKSLMALDLSNNNLHGEIPENLVTGCIKLELLVLSNNSLQGHLFSKSFNLQRLRRLQLDENLFRGEIPESLSKCTMLQGLYLSENNLSGKIPRWLGNLSSLQHIILPKNHLKGPIPKEICQLDSLQILDMSDNNIYGSLPSCLNLSSIQKVHLSKNRLHGGLKEGTFFNSPSLVTLDLSYNRLNGSIPDWIGELSQLGHIILAHNDLEGEVPTQLCQLNYLRLIDLSHNNFFGHIPDCLDNISISASYNDTSITKLEGYYFDGIHIVDTRKAIHETFEFTTKNIDYTYQGKVVRYMSGINLSFNKLIGEIPPQIGNMLGIRSLNLSHNSLTGSIPSTFSNLKQVESLDLSYNKLNGKIPRQLVELNALAVFSVAHNNLSGKIPEWTAQFATFNESCYEGNPFLCGLPLPKSCNENELPVTLPDASTSIGEGDNLIDMDSFFITFIPSYVIVLLGFFGVLYVNPFWRRRWFYLIEKWMTSCYYFVVDNFIPARFYR